MAVALRRAQPADAARLALVGQATFLETFAGILPGGDIVLHCERQHATSVYERWLADREAAVWLATLAPQDAPVGYAVLQAPDLPLPGIGAGDWELKRIYLLSRCQGLGVGRRLVEVAVKEVRARGGRRLLLGVYARNEAALAFYAKVGFHPVGERTFRVGEHDYHDAILARDVSEKDCI